MTNFEIITSAAIAEGIYTKEQIEKMLSTIGEVPLHTFAEWKRMGFSVKKGEHAKLTCNIWRWNSKKGVVPMEDGNDVEVDESHFYKTKAFFFTGDQVERIARTVTT